MSVKHLDRLLVQPGKPARLSARDPATRLGLVDKERGGQELATLVEALALLQNRLYAEGRRALLVVLQGMDASGKDGTIRRVFTGVNPQGCDVTAFKVPSTDELAHDYLWRVHARCPRRGEIGIWNRSHYEDVVTVSVMGLIDDEERDRRIAHIRTFEQMLADEGTTMLKLFLHISPEEQRGRLQARLDDPEKRWKFNLSDLDARRHWRAYQAAYDRAITETSTDRAPWYVVPGNRKWVRDVAVAKLLVRTLQKMDPRVPAPTQDLDGVVVP